MGERSGHSILFLYHARIFFWVLLDIFNFKRGSVCSPSSFCQEDRFGKTHALILFFLPCILCVCGSAFFVSICVGSSVCVCACMPVCRYMSPRDPAYVSTSFAPSCVLHRENLVLNNQVSPVLCLRGTVSYVGPVALGRDRVYFLDARFGRSP